MKMRRFAYVWWCWASTMGLLAPSRAHAQSPPARPAFDVASIKPIPRCLGGIGLNNSAPGRLAFPCISLQGLVWWAYTRFDGLRYAPRYMNIVGLQDWMTLEHFDIDARAEGHAHIAEMAGP